MSFNFEKLDVYQEAIQWMNCVEELREKVGKKFSTALQDQLSRASSSISLNLAEGTGRWHKGEKRQFFWFARGSAYECVPIIKLLHERKLIDDEAFRECYERLEKISRMVSGLINSVDKLGERSAASKLVGN